MRIPPINVNVHYIRTQPGRKQSSGTLAFYGALYFQFVMAIVKLCSHSCPGCPPALPPARQTSRVFPGWDSWVFPQNVQREMKWELENFANWFWIQSCGGSKSDDPVCTPWKCWLLSLPKWVRFLNWGQFNCGLTLGNTDFDFIGCEERITPPGSCCSVLWYTVPVWSSDHVWLCNKSGYSDVFKLYVSCRKIHISPLSSSEAHISWPWVCYKCNFLT